MITKRVGKQIGRIFAGGCCAVFVFVLFFAWHPSRFSAKTTMDELNSVIENLENDVKKAEEAREQASAHYNAVKNDYDNLKARKEAIDAEMEAIDAEANALRQLLLGYAEQQDYLNRRIATLEMEQEERMTLLKERLRLNYEDRMVNLLSSLFASQGLYDFLTAIERLQLLAEQDDAILRAYEGATIALEQEKERLAESVKTAEEKAITLRETLVSLENKQKELLSMMETLEKDADAYLKALEQAEKEEAAFRQALQEKLDLLASVSDSEYRGGDFLWPLPAKHTDISSYFGNRTHPVTGKPQFHEGIDIPAPYKTEIYCVAIGTVVETGSHYANGKYVLVDHGGGIVTSYSHLSVIQVRKGDILEQGDVLGLVGSTGWSTGNHLDLSVYVKGEAVDPLDYYPDRKS